MKLKVLSETDVEQFIELGYAKVAEAFPVKQALAAQDFLWERVAERGVRREDKSTWTQPMVRINESYAEPVFQACATERMADAIEDLVGPGRWRGREQKSHWGWWPVNFAHGADQPWDVPKGGWHWDGQHFRHSVDAPDQGLLLLCMFSEIGPRGGGTVVAEGSHQVVARYLQQYPDGIEHRDALRECPQQHAWLKELMGAQAGSYDPVTSDKPATEDNRISRFMDNVTVDEDGTRLRVAEITANPGDVFLCHPFLYHAASQNHSGRPRFMCHRTTPLKERMSFQRADGGYSPLEISIKQAIQAGY